MKLKGVHPTDADLDLLPLVPSSPALLPQEKGAKRPLLRERVG